MRIGRRGGAGTMRWHRSRRIESRPRRRSRPDRDSGALLAERRNRGDRLYHAGSDAPVTRLRLTGPDDRVEVLYRSLWKETIGHSCPLGRTARSVDDALRFIASKDTFRAAD